MAFSTFDGQQEGERILYVVFPHIISLYIIRVYISILALSIVLLSFAIPIDFEYPFPILPLSGIVFALMIFVIGWWVSYSAYSSTVSYITDRRIIRFERIHPMLTTKRALFWNEALKAKAYAPNIIYKLLNIGTVVIEPHISDHEDIAINAVWYFEDIANYIDKILYIIKNKPEDISTLKPFVTMPKGKRN